MAPAASSGPSPWQPLRTGDGSWTLVHGGLDQACHSRSGAWREARERYARPTSLRARARAGELGDALSLCDVGTGLGWNLAAALAALEGTGVALHAVTFECDAGVIRSALELLGPGTRRRGVGERWLGRVLDALERALDGPASTSSPAGAALGTGGVELLSAAGEHRGWLRLELGDARERLPLLEHRAPFQAVFLDPFSPGVDPPLWDRTFLAGLARRMGPGSLLSTYTASLEVRTRLAAAGLKVGPGPRVGAKAAGTLASPDRVLPPLPERVARKLARRLERLSGEKTRPEEPSRDPKTSSGRWCPPRVDLG